MLLVALLAIAAPAAAQTFPPLSGRVVDNANILPPADEAALTQKLESLEKASTRQLVVATVPDLQGLPIEDYGYQLGRHWGIGQKKANNGAILIVAPNDRKVRIEVGYGLEPILTDAFSSLTIQNQILPRFKAGDYPGGIHAGVDALVAQLAAPPEVAEREALEAAARQREEPQGESSGGGSFFPLIVWAVILFVFFNMRIFGGRGRRRRGPWGGRRYGGGGSALPIILWTVANEIGRSRGSGGGWSGGGGGGFGGFGGGGGGFSGGGGSFGGGGASGGW